MSLFCDDPKVLPGSRPPELSQPRIKRSSLIAGTLKVVDPSPEPYVVPMSANKTEFVVLPIHFITMHPTSWC